MVARRSLWFEIVLLLVLLLPFATAAEDVIEPAEWDQSRVTALAGELHAGVTGLRDEMRQQKRGIESMQAAIYYELIDNLRLIERESSYLHRALESGANQQETLPAYRRIAMLRRDCAEDMQRAYLESSALKRISRAQAIVEQMDPFYGFDPKRPDHERVLRR